MASLCGGAKGVDVVWGLFILFECDRIHRGNDESNKSDVEICVSLNGMDGMRE